MPPVAIRDPATLDASRILYDLEAIRRGNPQHFEMEQLTAVLHFDPRENLIAGFRDVGREEFWVGNHPPGLPSLPGVLICEAAAQLCGFFCHLIDLIPSGFLGFGGLEKVRFRGLVRPGDRLFLIGRGNRVRRRRMIFETQGFVSGRLVFHGRIIGFPLDAAPSPSPSGSTHD